MRATRLPPVANCLGGRDYALNEARKHSTDAGGRDHFRLEIVKTSRSLSTIRDTPVTSATSVVDADGLAASSRNDPFWRSSAGFPLRSTTAPRASTHASLVGYPAWRMIRRSCGNVMVLPGFSRMSAVAFSSDTSTDSTPSSFLRATLTAWAQNAQSMPSTFSCTRRSSEKASDGSSRSSENAAAVRMVRFIVSVPFRARKSM